MADHDRIEGAAKNMGGKVKEGVGKAEAERFARRLLVDGFRDRVLAPSKRAFPGLFTYADFSGVAGTEEKSFWYDEIHPTEAGFGTLAPGLNAMIRAALPAAKRGALR